MLRIVASATPRQSRQIIGVVTSVAQNHRAGMIRRCPPAQRHLSSSSSQPLKPKRVWIGGAVSPSLTPPPPPPAPTTAEEEEPTKATDSNSESESQLKSPDAPPSPPPREPITDRIMSFLRGTSGTARMLVLANVVSLLGVGAWYKSFVDLRATLNRTPSRTDRDRIWSEFRSRGMLPLRYPFTPEQLQQLHDMQREWEAEVDRRTAAQNDWQQQQQRH